MPASPQVVIVGSYVQDHAWFCDAFPQRGETRIATGFNTGPGGKGFNQAVACQRQGVPTAFVGAIGDDSLGGNARAFADAEKLDARWQTVADAPTAASSIVVDARGENRIVVSLGANLRLTRAFVRAQCGGLREARVLLCQLESDLSAVTAAYEWASDAGLLRVLNPAPMHPDFDVALLRSIDLLTPNETEFALLARRFGHAVDADSLATMDDASLHALVRAMPLPSVVITLGSQGCFVSHGQARHGDEAAYYRLAAAPATAIDSTGAGDAFSGALVAALLRFEGRPLRDAVVHANCAAAMSTEIVGTAPAMPSFEAVIARYGA